MLYRCIHCGSEQERKSAGTCPDCGYKMFPAPFDKAEILRREIYDFLQRLVYPELTAQDFCCFRIETAETEKRGQKKEKRIGKAEDDRQRFPGFEKLRGYVCSAKRTEEFRKRLDQTIEELSKYLHTPYSQTYQVDLIAFQNKVAGYDAMLGNALELLSVSERPEAWSAPAVTANYTETPEDHLLALADPLLDALKQLSAKIETFIRKNNIYQTAYLYKTEISGEKRSAGDKDPNGALAECLAIIQQVLEKRYVLDILSDGSDELKEMLTPFWNAVYVLMKAPIFQKKTSYCIAGETEAYEDHLGKILTDQCAQRCPQTVQLLHERSILGGWSEQQLAELYDAILAIEAGVPWAGENKKMTTGESEKKLESMIGLQGIKESVLKIKAYALANKDSDALNLHMCFYGNPGTGKTEVARLIVDILYENKILPTNDFVEVDRGGLVGQYLGETPQKTMRAVHQAMGGVLFVDEAYALIPKDGGGWDYGHEAIATLIKAMEDYRGKFCVILAGYKNEMLSMIDTNPGFASRIQFTLDFPNYAREELRQIASLMLEKRNYTITQPALQKILDITDLKRQSPNFANAREVRNILDQVVMCQSVRALGTKDRDIGLVDVEKYIQDAKLNLPAGSSEKKILTGEEELEQLIGLAAVKRTVKKIRAYAVRNRGDAEFNLHMCFTGSPGTGKTQVARLLSRILYDAGVLREAKMIETDAHGLMGRYVGETAPKTMEKINEADSGVLFIDEAYALTAQSGESANYGSEALAVLLKEMEDRRGRFCVILAGYKEEMETMLSSNPGLKSRIQFRMDFPDYSHEELGEIAKLFLQKKKYEIQDDALSRILEITEYYRKQPDFANARTVRNLVDQVLLNQNLRADEAGDSDDNTILLEDVEAYLADEGIDLRSSGAGTRRIGFV